MVVNYRDSFWRRVILSSFVFIGLAVLLFVSGNSVKAQEEASGRLVTIYDRGNQQVLLTEAATIADALTEAGVELDRRDVVEPRLDEKLVANEYKVNIYRARPVTIIDGAIRQKVMTPYQTAVRIAEDAEIKLYPEDDATVAQSTDLLTNGAGLELVVDRATAFDLTLFGKRATARTQATTVGEMLDEKDVQLGENDRVVPSLETTITPDIKVQVWREGKQTVSVEEEVDFPVETIKDADRPLGYREVRTPGVKGLRNVTYEITVKDGVESDRVEIASLETKAPVKQVEVIGAKLPTPTNPSENQVLGKAMMLQAGYGEDQWPCLYNLWMRESGWRVNAGNPTSGAYGIPQSLPASKMASHGADYMTSARTQISWGLSYIKGRYGSPCGAWNHFLSNNWY